jgi:hypothetical protein
MTADRVALIDWDEAHVDVPDLDLVLPGNAAGLDDGAHDLAAQASAAWEAAVCRQDEYAVKRLAEVRAVLAVSADRLPCQDLGRPHCAHCRHCGSGRTAHSAKIAKVRNGNNPIELVVGAKMFQMRLTKLSDGLSYGGIDRKYFGNGRPTPSRAADDEPPKAQRRLREATTSGAERNRNADVS